MDFSIGKMARELLNYINANEVTMFPDFYKIYPPNEKSSLIPLLQDTQDVYGYLSEEQMKLIARYTAIPLSRVYGVATFYNQFRLKPLGKNIIRVCRGTACHVKNSSGVLYALEVQLGIKAGDTTRDKNFTIEVVNCIGACSIAPVITINEEYYGRLAVKEVAGIIKKFMAKANTPAKVAVKVGEEAC